jgi:cyclin-dependent kinase 7
MDLESNNRYEKYNRGQTLGEGTWGIVYEAIRKKDRKVVAIKRMKGKDPKSGVDFTALREVKYLQDLRSPYIIDLIEVYLAGGILHMVLEFCPYTLERVIFDKKILLRTIHVKCYMSMLLKGLKHCHQNFILHRGNFFLFKFIL